MTGIYAVAGSPVLHSRSPRMFNEAFRALSMDAVYTRISASSAFEVIDLVRKTGIGGFNVTSPFKEDIIPCLDEVDGDAARIGSVNTVVKENGRFKGYNTDIAGVRDALLHMGIEGKDKRAVVIGASGAGKAAVSALLSLGFLVVLINRSVKRAEVAAEALGCRVVPFGSINESVRNAHVVVSCVPTKERMMEPDALRRGLVVLDANYSAETPLQRDARSAGATLIDGREWLLYQALPAFTRFTGNDAPVEVMREALYGRDNGNGGKPNVALLGFMGAGKSTIALAMAKRTGMTLIDTDKEIVERTGLSIPDIFERRGEDGFRKLEAEEVLRVQGISNGVISLGGGVPLREENMRIIRGNSVSVWLWAGKETILQRTGNGEGRPLLQSPDGTARMEALFTSRLPFYCRASDLVINTDNATPERIVERICYEIGKPLRD